MNQLFSRRSQSIKIDTGLSIDKSVSIVIIGLIDIACIDHSVKIDISFIYFFATTD